MLNGLVSTTHPNSILTLIQDIMNSIETANNQIENQIRHQHRPTIELQALGDRDRSS